MNSEALPRIQVAIVDDEPLARYRIRSLLESNDDVSILGEANDVQSAVKLIDESMPDLVFLDIRMPDGTGVEVLKAVQHEPDVIFTTAFGSYAVAAFEIGVVDYLVKPFSRQRFRQALRRAQESRRSRLAAPSPNTMAERLFVSTRTGAVGIEVAEIDYLKGQGDYVQLLAKNRNYLVPIRLKEFEQKLCKDQFVRIHRSHIVNTGFIAVIRPIGGGRCSVELNNGQEICASRKGTALLRGHVLHSRKHFTGGRK